MRIPNLKKSLSLGSLSRLGKGGGKGNNLIFLIGAGTVVAAGALWLLSKQGEAKANFANSANSINESASYEYGDSMNSFYPIKDGGSSNTDTHLHPVVYGGKRGFPDYTNMKNSLPTPFVEINFPQDRVGKGAKLANVIDKGTYVSSYGSGSFSHYPQFPPANRFQ